MNKEQRELLKEIEKAIQIAIRCETKSTNCKLISNSIYERVDNCFAHAVWFVRFYDNQYQLVIRAYIKPYSYDSLFWTIFGMEENLKQRDGFRANGAYVAPSIQRAEKIYVVKSKTDVEAMCSNVICDFTLGSKEFITKVITEYGNFDSYIFNQSGVMDEKLLKMLAYINLNDYSSAMSIAQDEIEQGRTGRFENKGIGINEHIMNYCIAKIHSA